MKYAIMTTLFVFPVAVGFSGDALIMYNLAMGIIMWLASLYTFCKEKR